MDIFLIASLQKAFINPPEPCGALLSGMDLLLWAKYQHPFTGIIKLGHFLYICISLLV